MQPCSGIEIPLASPATVHILLIERSPRGRAQPQIPVDDIAVRRRLSGQPGVFQHRHVNRRVQRVEFAELSRVSELDRLLEIRHAASLSSRLEDALLVMHRGRQSLAGIDGDAARFLAVDVFSCFGSQNGCVRVPAISRCHNHRIDIVAVQQFAQVAVQHAIGVAVMFVDQFLAGVTAGLLHIGDRHAPNVFKLQHRFQVIGTPRSDADDTERDLFTGSRFPFAPQHTRRQNCGSQRRGKCGGGRCRQEITTCGMGFVSHRSVLAMKQVNS